MPLSSQAQEYLESLWGERLGTLIKKRDDELERVKRGLIHTADIYAQRGFWNFAQPELDHVANIGAALAECLLIAYQLDGQPLSVEVIEAILVNMDRSMESASITLISQKQNEVHSLQS